jgi:PAS domain S-box-containing protein
MEHTADEIKNLKACINDLISVLALPAIWTGSEPSEILSTLLDVLLGMLRLDFAYARLSNSIGVAPMELVRLAHSRNLTAQPQEIGQMLNPWMTGDPSTSPLRVPNPIGEGEVSIALLPLGLQDEVGVLVAGSKRADFPTETERLLLQVAANQAAIGLEEARLRSEQRRMSEELDQRVIERTRQLTVVNEELRQENIERKRAEEALRKSEERWRAVFENSAAGIALANFSGRFLAANSAYQKMLGYSEEELRELSFLDITHEDYREANSELDTQLLEGKREYFEMEKRYRRKDGNLIWARVYVSLVPGRESISRFFLAIVEDITERKWAEDALRHSEADLAEAQRLSHTGSFGWRTSTGEIIWSEESFRIFEYDPANCKPTVELVLQRIHPEDIALVQQTIDRASRDGTDWDLEHRLLMPDGSVKYVHVVTHAVRDESGKLEFVGAVLDVTERKQAEEALHKAQAELAHVTRVTTLGEMTASIAHEINQPLAAVVNNASACLRWLAASNLEEARQSAALVIADGHRAGEIINRIRALINKAPPQKDWLDINETIIEVIALARSEAQKNRVSLQSQLSSDLPLILADRIQLQQVILNLMINAIEAMNGINDAPRELLVSSAKGDSQGVLVTVRDSGPGLDPKSLDHLFDAFYTTKPQGMGMGLAISRSIIEAYGGRLWATANEGRGATFQFTLPTGGERMF